MKTKIFATIVFFLTISAVIANTVYLQVTIEKIHSQVEAVDMSSEDAEESFSNVYAFFKKHEKVINLTVNHEDLTAIEEAFSEIEGLLSIKSYDEAEVRKNRLLDSLEHLRRLSGVNFDSVM